MKEFLNSKINSNEGLETLEKILNDSFEKQDCFLLPDPG